MERYIYFICDYLFQGTLGYIPVGEFIKNMNDGQPVYSPKESPLPVEIGIVDGHLIVGIGKNEFTSIAGRIAAMKMPSWLKKIQARLPVDRVANITYVNIEHFAATDGEQPLPPELAMLGLDQIRSVACVTGLSFSSSQMASFTQSAGDPSTAQAQCLPSR